VCGQHRWRLPPTPCAGDTARAMSQENVERFLEAVESWNRQDLSGVLRIMDPEIRFEHRLAALQGTYVGLDGVRSFLADARTNPPA
jgi:hypothetical protein